MMVNNDSCNFYKLNRTKHTAFSPRIVESPRKNTKIINARNKRKINKIRKKTWYVKRSWVKVNNTNERKKKKINIDPKNKNKFAKNFHWRINVRGLKYLITLPRRFLNYTNHKENRIVLTARRTNWYCLRSLLIIYLHSMIFL